jgi:hypothetical protein
MAMFTGVFAPVPEAKAAGPAPIDLGTAGNYEILAETGVSTIPYSRVIGNVGVSPYARGFLTGWSLITEPTDTYFTSAQVVPPGKLYAADQVGGTTSTDLTAAVGDMKTAYNNAAGATRGVGTFLNAGNPAGTLGGQPPLVPGVYTWDSGLTITADLTLYGSAEDVWIFQINGTLGIDADKQVILKGGALAKNIFWQVTGAVTLGARSRFEGIILAKTNIALVTGATVNGRLLAQTEVALDQNTVGLESTELGTITVIKNTTGGDGTFHFTVSGGSTSVSPFDITTDSGIGSYTVPVIAGSYTVTEGAEPAGWVATGVIAKDVVVPFNGTGTATFNNVKLPAITVIKNTVGGDGTFPFTISDSVYNVVSAFNITTTTGQGVYSVPVTAGTYYVTEGAEPAGWVSNDVYMVKTATVPTDGTVATAVYFNNTKVNQYTVTYNANGGTGAQTDSNSPYAAGATVTVLDQGTMAYTGHTFSGWNTATDGTGTPYAAAATFTIAADTILYAQWTVTYVPPYYPGGNGTITGTVSPVPVPVPASTNTVYHQTFFIGYPDGTFKPDRNVSRAEVAAALTRALGLGWSNTAPSYPDVPATHWSSGNIQIMKDEGIMIGDASGTFRPDAFITRAEAATLVLRMLKIAPIQNLVASSFKDVPVTNWAAGYIEAMQKNGLITGYPDGTYKPTANILRSEFAALANRALGRGIGSSSQTAGLAASVLWPDVPATYWAYLDILEASTPHTVVNAVKLNRTIVLKTKTIPLFSDGASTVTIHKVGDVLTAIVPVDGLLPNGSVPAARQVTVVITIKLKP